MIKEKTKSKTLKGLKQSVNKQFCELGVCEINHHQVLCDDIELLKKQIEEKFKLILNK